MSLSNKLYLSRPYGDILSLWYDTSNYKNITFEEMKILCSKMLLQKIKINHQQIEISNEKSKYL